MRRTEPLRIGDILGEIISDNGRMSKGLCEGRALGAWAKVVGPVIAEHTIKISLRNGRMYVSFSTAAARQECFLKRKSIMDSLNAEAGMKVIDYIQIG